MRVVLSIGELRDLPRDGRVNGRGAREPIAFDIPGLARHDQIRAERTLNRYQSRCGCGAGAACFLAALCGGGAYLASTGHVALSLGFLAQVIAALIAALALGLAGKLVTLEVTRLQFAGACRRYWKELSTLQGGARPRKQAQG